MEVEVTLKSSTNLIKHGRRTESPVINWTPVEFQAHSPEEADELHRLAEGITRKEVWLGYEVEAANAPPSSMGSFSIDQLEQEEALLPEVIKALFSKRRRAQNCIVFKPSEMPAETYIWPTIEKAPVESDLAAESLTESQQQAIDLEHVQQQAQELVEGMHQQAQTDAQKIIASAQIQSDDILEQARKSAETIVQEAKNKEGELSQQSYQTGMHNAHQEAVGLLAAARDVLNAAQAWHEQVLQRSEEDVLNLTRIIAQNLFGSGTVIDEDTLKSVFLKAMDDAKSLGSLRLRANPQDVETIGQDWIEQQAALQGFQVEIIPSEGVQRGGCYIEGDYGALDARVETKLERIFDKIEEVKNLPPDAVPAREDADSIQIISQAVHYVSSAAPADTAQIHIAQPSDETEAIDLADENPPGEVIDLGVGTES
jgi:flagellar assembly protein FliH